MNLLFITTKDAWGGSELLWCDAAERALDSGHSVSIVMPRQVGEYPGLPKLVQKGAKVMIRPPRLRPTLLRRVKWRASGVRHPEMHWWRSHFPDPPDAICVSQGGTYCALSLPGLVPWLVSTGLPFILLCHSNRANALPPASSRAEVKALFGKAVRVCFVAQDNIRTACRFLGMDLPNAVVVQNPVNLADTSLVPWPDEGRLRMACVGRLVTVDKGQDLLLEALGTDAWKNREVEVSLIGGGPDREMLKNLVCHFGLEGKVSIPGFDPDLRRIWAAHHMLILPSVSEGTPISLIEAQLCGRPAVVTRVDGNPDWVEEGETGFIAEAPTVYHVREALERAWENRHQWKRMGEAAREACLAKRDTDPGRSLLGALLVSAGAHLD